MRLPEVALTYAAGGCKEYHPCKGAKGVTHAKGGPKCHADGPDHNPKLSVRDALHVRPGALEKALDALMNFVKAVLSRQTRRKAKGKKRQRQKEK